MKYHLRTSKTVQYIGVVLLILVFAFASIGATSQTNEQKSVTQIAISNYLAAQQNSDLSDEKKIKAAIDAYFTARYEGQKLVEAQDFSLVIEDDTLDWVKKEKDKREIEIYIASMFDLGYQSYSFALDYDFIKIKKNNAVVKLRESHQVVYEAIAPEISELANLQHTITLHKKGRNWVLYKDEYEDEYTKLLDTTPIDKIKQQIDENYKSSQDDASKTFRRKDSRKQEELNSSSLLSYTYLRSAAKTFSYNNATIKQAPIPQAIIDAYKTIYGVPYPSSWPKKYNNEDAAGGDCTNFVSQSIFAGTRYTSGDANYFYPTPDDFNWYYQFSQTPKGSSTWISVGKLYSFLIGNASLRTSTSSGQGPYGVGKSKSSFCQGMSPGDPIFMKSGTAWAHAVIIYAKPSPCTSPNDIRVNSHNAYLRNELLTHLTQRGRRG